MKKVLVLLLVVLISSFVQAQFKLEVTQEISKKTGGEFEITGKTFDQVWSAITRSMLLLKFKSTLIEKGDKLGQMNFRKKPSVLARGVVSLDSGGKDKIEDENMPGWEMTLEEDEEGKIKIFCIYDYGVVKGTKPFKKLCKKLEEILKD